jgi:16S rRNA pseudouridine516 synthase
MDPDARVPKVYLVETSEPITAEVVTAFARGFHFHTEDIVTRPAELVILGERRARLTLHEGRYHQVKRMFHRVHNRVVRLHRESIGGIALPEKLAPGMWRPLTRAEICLR